MKYPVLKKFRDRESGEIYEVGSEFEANAARAKELQKRGFLGKADEKKVPNRSDKKDPAPSAKANEDA